MRIDLHLHSTASDGSLTPTTLVETARAGGLHVIALTDHDTVAGLDEAGQAAAGRIHLIPGLELSSTHAGAELHMLGYFVDPEHRALEEYAQRALQRRRERMRGMIGRLQKLGISVPEEDVLALAGPRRLVGRPHLARVLVQRGHAQSFAEAFDRYIGDAAPAFLPTDLLSARAAIDLVHMVGGVAVWAHPRSEVVEGEIAQLVEWGLDGMECFRPRCPADESLRLENVAQRHGLLVTGGSDWHGIWHGRLGDFSVGREEVGRFLDRGGI